MPESWSPSENGAPRSSQRSRLRRGPDPLEQGLDRLVSAGRQLVDGVSGARPGVRAAGRTGPARASTAAASASLRPRLDQLGRWVEDKLDWILDEEEDWREPWQDSVRQAARPVDLGSEPPVQPSRRRPLEARSRRVERLADADPWPDDASFVIPRWQRQPGPAQEIPLQAPADQGLNAPADGRRPLPRSTRLRTPLD